MQLGRYLSLVNSAITVLLVGITLFVVTEYSYQFIEYRFRVHLVREAATVSLNTTEFLTNRHTQALTLGSIIVLAEPESHVRILVADGLGNMRVATTSVHATATTPCDLLNAKHVSLLRERVAEIADADILNAYENPVKYTYESQFCYSQPQAPTRSGNGGSELLYSCQACRTHPVWIALMPIYAPPPPDSPAGQQSRQPLMVGLVEVVRSKEFLLAVRSQLRLAFVSASLICFLVTISASYGVARFFTSPLKNFTAAIRSIQNTTDVASPVRVDQTRGIQEIAELTTAFQDLQHRLGQSLRNRQQMAANLSHELRNALGALALDIATLLKRGQDDPYLREIGQDMQQNVAELIEMSDRSLQALSSGSSDMPLNFEYAEPAVLIRETLSAVQSLAARGNVTLTEGELDDGAHLHVDRVYFKNDVLLEIIINAIDYAGSEGEVEVGCNATAEWVNIWIRDTGPGIDPDHHDTIFEPYFRINPTFNPGLNNRGLGLSLARSMVRRHQGEIHVESAPGQGSVFSVVLPNHAAAIHNPAVSES